MRYLLCLIVILSSTVAAAATVWWHTIGAAVLQSSAHSCSLYIYNPSQAAIFSWDVDGAENLAFQDRRQFQFTDDEPVVVTVHLDDRLLSADTGYGNNAIVIIPVQQIDDQLARATQVSVTVSTATGDATISLPMPTSKMPSLLTAVQRCRAVLK